MKMDNHTIQCLLLFVISFVACFDGSSSQSTLATVSTSDQYGYQWVNGLGTCRNSVAFSVQACNDAHIALAEGTSNSDRLYEIVIGGRGNTQSYIRRKRQGDALVIVDHRALDCRVARDFWVSWAGGVIAVGTGSLPGHGEFMRYKDQSPYRVNYVGVSTGWGATGQYIFKSVDVTLSTPSVYQYQYLPEDFIDFDCQQYVLFDVTACNDAHVALSESSDTNSNTYEIVIGAWNNEQSVIRPCKQTCSDVARYSHSPLSCTEARSFWVSWNGNRIAVGTGQDVGVNEFIHYPVTSPYSVHRVGFSTWFTATGVFRVRK